MARVLFAVFLLHLFAAVLSSPAVSKPGPGWPFSTSVAGHSFFGPSPILFPKLPSFPEIMRMPIPIPIVTISNTDEHGSKDASTEFGVPPDFFFSVSVNKDPEAPEQQPTTTTTTTPKTQETTTRGLPIYFRRWRERQMAKKAFAVQEHSKPRTLEPRPAPPMPPRTIRIPILSPPDIPFIAPTAQESRLERLLNRQADLMALLQSSTLLNALNAMRLNQYINKLTSIEPQPHAIEVASTPFVPTPKAADPAPFPLTLFSSHVQHPSKLTAWKPKPARAKTTYAVADSHELSSADFNRYIDSMVKADEIHEMLPF